MYYTTDFQAFCFIMRDLTLRSSSLCSANLNDPQEQRRVGITNYAGSKFIVCFSHIDHEQVPFWISYGGSDRATKILLKFKNFANNFSGAFYTDYAFIADKKKVFFSGTEYERTVNRAVAVHAVHSVPGVGQGDLLGGTLALGEGQGPVFVQRNDLSHRYCSFWFSSLFRRPVWQKKCRKQAGC